MNLKTNIKEIEQFERFIFYSPDSCWYWTGSANPYGYFTCNGLKHKAHRRAYELYKGVIPDGLCVCHTCDNPRCVNPNHLFTGSVKENNTDRKFKGRNRNQDGIKHNKAVLEDVAILSIRDALKMGHKLKDVALYFNVSFQHISAIKLGKRWGHII